MFMRMLNVVMNFDQVIYFVYILIRTAQRPELLECVTKNYFSYFSTKTYVVGTQKNLSQ